VYVNLKPQQRSEFMPDIPIDFGTATRYCDIVGQDELITRLIAFCDFYTSKGNIPGHILLAGGEGMGQYPIASAFANECGRTLQRIDASKLEVQGDLTAILTNLREGQVLMLSNAHLLRKPILERISQALRDYKLDIFIGRGKAMRRHEMEIRPFTLIATCPKRPDCPPELIKELSLLLDLKPYSRAELGEIAMRIAGRNSTTLELDAADILASASEGSPANVEVMLRRLWRAINKSAVSRADVAEAFKAFGIRVRADGMEGDGKAIDSLSGVDFEKVVANLLSRMGFHAEMTRASGDGGIDVIASLDKPIVGGRYLFQCKRFSPINLIGSPTLRDFYGAVTADRAVKGVFITTSDFTPQAREFGEKVGLELINFSRLQALLKEYGLSEANWAID
jgi:Holliday junction resolvasome RuvABC ATP-dependent DNA helicase subunit